jgi:hypothetical protein
MQHPISIAATSRQAASSNTFLAYRRDHGGALCGIGHRAANLKTLFIMPISA